MSQDNNNLFSALKRPRETLGANAFQSSIPQPTSVLKRSNPTPGGSRLSSIPASRMSLAPPRATGSEFGLPSTVKRESSRYSSRKSYASSSQPAPDTARRSSVFQRSASMGGSNSWFSNTVSATVQKDTRPLKDKTYQARAAQQIMEYLLQSDFEIEMKHSLTPNSLKSPTQKDFVMIFQWMYRRLDPNYRFQKSIDNEVMGALKMLRYPYANSITKSQLAAVGSANSWPLFLGMLHWLLALIQTIDAVQSGKYDNAAIEGGYDVWTDKVIFQYCIRCYEAWLAGEDDHTEFEQELAAEFEQKTSAYASQIQEMEAENAALKKELEELDDSAALQKLEDSKKILEGDIKKFEVYIESVSERSKKLRSTNERVRAEVAVSEKELEEMEAEKKRLQESLDSQGLTPQDIDRMNSDREKISKGLQQYTQKDLETREALIDREAEAQSKLDSLEHAVNRYNALGYQIGVIPVSSPNSGGKEFDLDIPPLKETFKEEGERLLLDPVTGFQPGHLLNRDLRHDVKSALNKLRQDIAARIHTTQDETYNTQEYIDRISEALTEKTEEVETLQARVHEKNVEYNVVKDGMNAEISSHNTQIEKRERNVRDLRIKLSSGLLEAEQALQSITIEYDQLKYDTDIKREKLHSDVEKMLTEVIQFKVHIQKSLEDYEAFVEDQLGGNDEIMEE